MDGTEASTRWSALHHGIDPAGVVLLRGWLRFMWWLARPLAHVRVPPVAATICGVLLALFAAWCADSLPWLALVLVLASVACDGLDGALAVLLARASARGAVADKVADRIADCAFAVVLWRCGAPWPLALAAGVISLLQEAARELRGGSWRRRITVSERPTRTVCTVLACGCAGLTTAQWPPTVCAAAWVALSVIGLAQLAILPAWDL